MRAQQTVSDTSNGKLPWASKPPLPPIDLDTKHKSGADEQVKSVHDQ